MNEYAAIFLAASSSLALEITLSRLLSVVSWYHLAFFAISTAMLGMTAGAVWVYRRPGGAAPGARRARAAMGLVGFAGAAPLSLLLLCLIPIRLELSAMTLGAMLLQTLACALPFFFSGITITVLLTRCPGSMARLYAADLAGAASGCLFVLLGLEVVDAPSLVLLEAAVAAFAGASLFAGATRRRLTLTLGVCLLALAAWNSSPGAGRAGIRPLAVKGVLEKPLLFEAWNSYSRIAVYPGAMAPPHLWGPSRALPPELVEQYGMNIDGDAGTVLRRFRTPADIEHLRYDVTNVAHAIRPGGASCVIGVGGGRDVQSALLFGHRPVVGVELNPIFVELLTGYFGELAGLAGNPDVELVVDEARSWLTRTERRFELIQMSLIDTWAATGAGAMTLSENALYTTEAWGVFLDRLAPGGVFTVSRWYNPRFLGENCRVLALAVAALRARGVDDPAPHLALISSGKLATLVLAPQPLSPADVEGLRQVADRLGFEAVILPGSPPTDAILRSVLEARGPEDLARLGEGTPFRYDPPTDQNPYFFSQVNLGAILTGQVSPRRPGVWGGNVTANLALLALIACLGLASLGTVLLPLALGTPAPGATPVSWAGAAYFSLIGAGFMVFEIALVQRFSLLLGHPTYALGVLLTGLIAATGTGSLLSDRLPLERRGFRVGLPLAAAALVLASRGMVERVVAGAITAPLATRILASLSVIVPAGLVLGCMLPLGMRLWRRGPEDAAPWYWGLNGVFGVLASAAAVLLSIHAGAAASFQVAAACYAAAGAATWRSLRARDESLPPS